MMFAILVIVFSVFAIALYLQSKREQAEKETLYFRINSCLRENQRLQSELFNAKKLIEELQGTKK